MNKIVLNNAEFEIDSFNKNTSYSAGTIMSTGYMSVLTTDISELNTLAKGIITSLKIYHDETLIYNLENINATIDNISEYLSGDHMSITINMTFKEEV